MVPLVPFDPSADLWVLLALSGLLGLLDLSGLSAGVSALLSLSAPLVLLAPSAPSALFAPFVLSVPDFWGDFVHVAVDAFDLDRYPVAVLYSTLQSDDR